MKRGIKMSADITAIILTKNEEVNIGDCIESIKKVVKNSGRFPLTAIGKIDLYPLFAEHCLNCSKEAWGLVLPTGIAVNDSSKTFFSKLIEENRLISLYDFENKEGLFEQFKQCSAKSGYKSIFPIAVRGKRPEFFT